MTPPNALVLVVLCAIPQATPACDGRGGGFSSSAMMGSAYGSSFSSFSSSSAIRFSISAPMMVAPRPIVRTRVIERRREPSRLREDTRDLEDRIEQLQDQIEELSAKRSRQDFGDTITTEKRVASKSPTTKAKPTASSGPRFSISAARLERRR